MGATGLHRHESERSDFEIDFGHGYQAPSGLKYDQVNLVACDTTNA